ncbi:MAG: hypothetical protein V2G42_03455 [bacterium JZ-2024 1]
MKATSEVARQKQKRTARKTEFFSNLDALKEIFSDAIKPLTLSELVTTFKDRYLPDVSEETIENAYILPVLRGQKNIFYETAEGWNMNYEALPEHEVAIEVLNQKRAPMSLKELRSEVARKMKLPVRRVYLMPHRARGLFKPWQNPHSEEQQWMLVTWEIANDIVYEMLQGAGREMSRKEIEDRLRKRDTRGERIYVFVPEGDTRFIEYRKGWALAQDAQEIESQGSRAPSWAVETNIRKKIRQDLPAVIQSFAGAPRPFSLDDITENLLKQPAEEVKKTFYFRLLLEGILELEGKGEIVRVRGTDPMDSAWRLTADVPPEVYSRPIHSIPFPTGPFEILSDEGLDPTLRPLLADHTYYFLDGDFSESAFPPGGMLLIITSNSIDTGSIALSPPLQGYLAKEMGIPFGVSSEKRPSPLVEILVRPPSSRVPELSCLINTETGILWGLGPWLEYEGVPGEGFHVQVDGRYTLSLTPVPEVLVPSLSDETLTLLLDLRDRATNLTLFEVVSQILANESAGLDGKELFHRVSFIRRVTRRHLYSLLSSHYAFSHREGNWRYIPERADWKTRLSSYAYAREFRGRRAFLLAQPTPRNPVESTPDGNFISLPPSRASLSENSFIILYSRANQAYYGFVILAGPPSKSLAPVKLVRLWDFLVSSPTEPPEISPKPTSLSTLSRERLLEILNAYDRIYYQTQLRKTTVRPFQMDSLHPVISQKVKDHIKRLEEILEGEQTTFLALRGISIQLQANPTYDELQKILEEKYYSRGLGTRIGETTLQRIRDLNLVRLPARVLVAPSGEGEFLRFLLDSLTEDLKSGGFAPEEDHIQIFAADLELTLRWSDIVKDRRRFDRIRQREDAVRLSEVAQAIAELKLMVVEPREIPFLVTSIGLSLLGYPEVRVLQGGPDLLLKDAPPNPADDGYDAVFGDLRGRPPKEARLWFLTASALKKPTARAVFVASFVPEDMSVEKVYDLENGLVLIVA